MGELTGPNGGDGYRGQNGLVVVSGGPQKGDNGARTYPIIH